MSTSRNVGSDNGRAKLNEKSVSLLQSLPSYTVLVKATSGMSCVYALGNTLNLEGIHLYYRTYKNGSCRKFRGFYAVFVRKFYAIKKSSKKIYKTVLTNPSTYAIICLSVKKTFKTWRKENEKHENRSTYEASKRNGAGVGQKQLRDEEVQ